MVTPLYSVALTIPANTPKSAWVCLDVALQEGVLDEISVLIPPGHMALAHMVVLRGQTQIIPHNVGGDIRGDSETFTFKVGIMLDEPEPVITLCGWNEDDTNPHTFYVRINVLPAWYAVPARMIYNLLHAVFKRMRLLPRGWKAP